MLPASCSAAFQTPLLTGTSLPFLFFHLDSVFPHSGHMQCLPAYAPFPTTVQWSRVGQLTINHQSSNIRSLSRDLEPTLHETEARERKAGAGGGGQCRGPGMEALLPSPTGCGGVWCTCSPGLGVQSGICRDPKAHKAAMPRVSRSQEKGS